VKHANLGALKVTYIIINSSSSSNAFIITGTTIPICHHDQRPNVYEPSPISA
jgi:hypothetical protein